MESGSRILLRPLLTEKMSKLEEKEKKYAFQVDRRANKIEIKNAIESKFSVEVAKVSTINVKGKKKELSIRSGGRVIRTSGRRSDWKKAVATLKEGFSIDLFEMEPEA